MHRIQRLNPCPARPCPVSGIASPEKIPTPSAPRHAFSPGKPSWVEPFTSTCTPTCPCAGVLRDGSGEGVDRGIGTLREGLVFAGLVRGGPPGHPPPNSGRPTGASASNPMGLGWMTWGSRRGWNREGADSPADKSVAKTGPGAQERSPCPPRSPEAFAIPSPPHALLPGLRPWGCFPSGAIQGSGALRPTPTGRLFPWEDILG